MCPKNKNLPSELIPTHCVVLASSKCTMLFAKVTQTSLILTPLHVHTDHIHDVQQKMVCAYPALLCSLSKLVTRIQLVQADQSFRSVTLHQNGISSNEISSKDISSKETSSKETSEKEISLKEVFLKEKITSKKITSINVLQHRVLSTQILLCKHGQFN